jgi:hypothetical protein
MPSSDQLIKSAKDHYGAVSYTRDHGRGLPESAHPSSSSERLTLLTRGDTTALRGFDTMEAQKNLRPISECCSLAYFERLTHWTTRRSFAVICCSDKGRQHQALGPPIGALDASWVRPHRGSWSAGARASVIVRRDYDGGTWPTGTASALEPHWAAHDAALGALYG